MPTLTTTDTPEGKALTLVQDDGTTAIRETQDKHPYVIPIWCQNSLDDHACAWGCMGILTDNVRKQGRPYCQGCEFYAPEPEESLIITYPLPDHKAWYGWEMAHSGEWIDQSSPVRFPCVAVLTKWYGLHSKWKNPIFKQRVAFIYPHDIPNVPENVPQKGEYNVW